MFASIEALDGRKFYAGDFNTILDLNNDIKGGKGCSHPKCTEYLNEYMDQNNIVDVWRIKNPTVFKATFIRNRSTIASALMERIDYCLIDYSLQQFVHRAGIMTSFSSDHAMPYVIFQFTQHKPGPGYWKFNNSLLQDDQFIQDVVQQITTSLTTPQMDILDKWELMKFTVKQCALRRSIQIARSEKNKLEALNKKLTQVENERDALNLNNVNDVILFQDHNEQINLIKNDIDELISKRTAGAMMRSRANWYEFSEKPSKYFFALEKHRYNKKTINKIKNESNDIIDSPQHILEFLDHHFTKVFARNNIVDIDPDYLALLDMPQVAQKDLPWLDAPIQLEEIHIALKGLNLDKCPGTDGLTVEFYRHFWPMIASTIHKLFKTIVERKILNRSARQAITSLMGKPKKDSLYIDNWRPLSLLNNDYKLYAKVIVNRMQSVADYLIDYDQKGFMKNRDIADNLLNLITILDYCNTCNLDAILISVDFHRAFDSCSWQAIRATLGAFGYGEKFIDMVMICYTDISTAVMNNNYWKSWIPLKNGVRQGCPLSGMLFCHLMSVLLLKIKQNSEIQGIPLFDKIKIADMFADDVWNCIRYDQNSFEELMNEYDDFYHFSGLAINYNKTEIMRMGSLKYSNAELYSRFPLIWSDGPIEVLGIQIHNHPETMSALNYNNVLSKIRNICLMWQGRSLNPIGKIQVINSLINSILVYKLRVLPSPSDRLLIQIKKTIRNFIWNDKPSRISYSRLTASYENGGLQLRDLDLVNQSVKLAFFDTLINNKKAKECIWKFWYLIHFGVSIDYLLQCNLKPKDILSYY